VIRNTNPRSGHIRSGDEPAHARSALRLRLWLTVFGLANAVAGVIVFDLLGSAPYVIGFVLLGLVSLVNLAVVARHIRQGAHYQPGRTIPPYRPVDDYEPVDRPPRKLTPVRTRRRRYLLLMGTCVLLIVLAWGWIRFYSVVAAGALTCVAALIPPFAAIITNADSPITHENEAAEDDEPD
jgi:Family of unknown function (DUF6343)/Protein of unknown function (DUF3099)